MNRDLGLLILRGAVGAMMAFGHGLGKVSKILAGNFAFADPIGIGPAASLVLAGAAEFLFCLAIVVGFKTRWAAVPPLITMLVAAFIVHGGDPWAKKELALMYAVPFLALILLGGGRFTLDTLLAGSRRRGRKKGA